MMTYIKRERVEMNDFDYENVIKPPSYKLFRATCEKDQATAWLRGLHDPRSITLRIIYGRYFKRHCVQ